MSFWGSLLKSTDSWNSLGTLVWRVYQAFLTRDLIKTDKIVQELLFEHIVFLLPDSKILPLAFPY